MKNIYEHLQGKMKRIKYIPLIFILIINFFKNHFILGIIIFIILISQIRKLIYFIIIDPNFRNEIKNQLIETDNLYSKINNTIISQNCSYYWYSLLNKKQYCDNTKINNSEIEKLVKSLNSEYGFFDISCTKVMSGNYKCIYITPCFQIINSEDYNNNGYKLVENWYFEYRYRNFGLKCNLPK